MTYIVRGTFHGSSMARALRAAQPAGRIEPPRIPEPVLIGRDREE